MYPTAGHRGARGWRVSPPRAGPLERQVGGRTSLLGVGAGGVFQHEATQGSEHSRHKDTGPEVRDGNTERSGTAG